MIYFLISFFIFYMCQISENKILMKETCSDTKLRKRRTVIGK